MEKEEKNDSYAHILKYTGIFGGVQGLGILIGLVRNKFAALLLGTTGMGLVALFNSTINMVVSAANFGIPTSGVHEISEQYGNSNTQLASTIRLIRSWSLIAALLGLVICGIFSPLLDSLTFFDRGHHILHFVLLAPAVACLIVAGGEMAVLKATRQLRALAFSSMCVVVASLLISVPIFYFWQYQGIVVVLVLQSLAQMLLVLRYSSRYYPYRVSLSLEFLGRGIRVVKLGLAFVIAGILSSGAEFLIRTYINRNGDLSDVGLFNAGWTLAIVYAGVVFSAMEADYYPRLSSIKEMGKEQNDCVNRQLEINVLLMGPILTVMILALPVLIPLLYDQRFISVLGMAQLAAVSMLFRSVYIPIEYLPLSKGQSRKFLYQETVCVVLLMVFEIMGYQMQGLTGLGVGIIVAYLIETLFVLIYSRCLYHYVLSKKGVGFIAIQLFFVTGGLVCAHMWQPSILFWVVALAWISLDIIVTLILLKTHTEVLDMLWRRFRK